MPDKDNFIITGNQAANYNQSAGFTNTSNSFKPNPLANYGRVIAVDLNDRSVAYEKITTNFAGSALKNPSRITGYAKPVNPTFTRLPIPGEIVMLVAGPSNQVGSIAGSNDVTMYYDGVISVQGTIDDNKVLLDFSGVNNETGSFLTNYKLGFIGAMVQPTPTPTKPETLGRKRPIMTPESKQISEEPIIAGIKTLNIEPNGIAVTKEQRVTVIGGGKVEGGKRINTSTGNEVLGKTTKEKINNFFTLYKDGVLNATNGTYVFPEVMMSQMINESGYGRSALGEDGKKFNFFGVTKGRLYTGNYGLYITHESSPGLYVDNSIGEEDFNIYDDQKGWRYRRAFRHYDTLEEGLSGYVKVVTNLGIYKDMNTQGTPLGQMLYISKDPNTGKTRYATSPTYYESNKLIIEELMPLFKDLYVATKQTDGSYIINKK